MADVETDDVAAPRNQSVFNRAWSQIARTVREIGPRRRAAEIALKPDLPPSDEERLVQAFEECVDHRGGEVAARARTAALGQAYLSLKESGRRRFAELLATRFDIDRAEVDAAIAAVQAADDERARRSAESHLREALEAPRVRILTQFNDLPDGVKFLVDMRGELLRWRRDAPALNGLQGDLRRLLVSWFDVGFLELRQLDWSAPAAILEKLFEYEAVHRIRSWADLKNRLDADRRVFAFFHPRMPDEPLIFVEVALVTGMADNVGDLLDEEQPASDPTEADSAIFYSISNAQSGLAGISFGDFLIKRVAAELAADLPNIKTFATLSPIPGFRNWLAKSPEDAAATPFSDDERAAILAALPAGAATDKTPDVDLIQIAMDAETWGSNDALMEASRAPLLRLAADYLHNRRRTDGRALDPVAHFHLSNGARMERLNWNGDRSSNGVRQSGGMMINYLYKLSEIDENHEAYAAPDRRIAASAAIRNAAKR